LYNNHMEQTKLQLSRTPGPLPQLVLNPEVKDIFSFSYEDIVIKGYDPQAAIKAPVAV
ncbi:MAG: thymidylate synthase, partial [Bacteroidota bacterium]